MDQRDQVGLADASRSDQQDVFLLRGQRACADTPQDALQQSLALHKDSLQRVRRHQARSEVGQEISFP